MIRVLRKLAILLAAISCARDASSGASLEAPLDLPRIYAAALGDTTSATAPSPSALGLDLMSDVGTYESSGRLPDSVATYLLRRNVVSEICIVRDSTYHVPRCTAKHARAEVRVSRVIRVSRDTVKVYVGGRSIQPTGDSTAAPYIPTGITELVTLVWRGKQWSVLNRQTTMII